MHLLLMISDQVRSVGAPGPSFLTVLALHVLLPPLDLVCVAPVVIQDVPSQKSLITKVAGIAKIISILLQTESSHFL